MKASIFTTEHGYYIHFHTPGSSQIWKPALADLELWLREQDYEKRPRTTTKWENALATWDNDPLFVQNTREKREKKRKGKRR